MKPKARTSDFVIQEAEGETLIYDLENNKAFCLNETSSLVMKYCNGKSDISDITAAINTKPKARITDEVVWLALNQLEQEGLLRDFDDVESTFDGMSRRAVIRKIGFASAVALPIISSLVAPKATNAQSAAGAVLDQCGPGFPVCGAGLACIGTFTIAVPTIFTSTGNGQCCSGGSFVSGTFCAAACGAALGCDSQPTIPAPADAACTGAGQVTCMYQ